MRVKLIYPMTSRILLKELRGDPFRVPYGLGVLMSFLRQNNTSVDIQDLEAEFKSPYSHLKKSKISKRLFKYGCSQLQAGHYTGISNTRNNLLADNLLSLTNVKGYDLIGISISSGAQILTSLLLAEKIKKEHNIPIVIGGPYVTAFAHLFFEKYNFIDYAVAGDGEVPLLKLTEHLQGKATIDKVPSLWHRDKAKPVFNGRTFYNIENQSCPDYDGLSLELYGPKKGIGEKVLTVPYSTSKGCPGKCTFCLYPKIDGPWQCKSAKKIVDDIVFLKQKYKSSIFSFQDSNFTDSQQHVNELCDELIRRKVDIQWNSTAKCKNLTQDLLFKMKKAGCYAFWWGVESGSNNVLKMMNKGINAEESAKLLKMAKGAGISNTISLVIGYPYETSQDLERTAALIKYNAKFIDVLNIYIFHIPYGSYLYNNQKALGIKAKKNKLSPFLYWYDFKNTEELISKSQSRAIIKNRNKIIRYSIRYVRSKWFRFPFNIILQSLSTVFARKLFILLYNTQAERFQFHYKNERIDSVLKQRASNAD